MSDSTAAPCSLADRFWSKVDRGSSCWAWTAALDRRSGYGRFQVDGSSAYAHRVSYELSVGAIPPGMEIDHLCRNRACVNPLHLEAVTPAENKRRQAAVITHCPQGHPYSGDNLYLIGGNRKCRACNRQRVAEHARRTA